jgi:hypothetical protein
VRNKLPSAALLISILLFALLILFLRNPLLVFKSDVVSFFIGGQIVKQGMGPRLYDSHVQLEVENLIVGVDQENLLPFRGLPFLALVFVPLRFITPFQAFVFLLVLNIVLLLVFSKEIAKKIDSLSSSKIFLLTLLFWPTIKIFIFGQISVFLLLVFLGIYRSQLVKKSLLGGLFTALLLIKPQMLVAFPWIFLLFLNKKEFMKGFALGVIPLIGVSLVVAHVSGFVSYIPFLLSTEVAEFGSRYWHMFSLGALFQSLSFSQINIFMLNALLAILFLALTIYRRKHLSHKSVFILSILSATLFSIHTLDHDLILLLFPILFLIDKRKYFVSLLLFLTPLAVLFSVGHVFSFALVGAFLGILFYEKDFRTF